MPGTISLLYGCVALFALAAVWHDRSMRALGWALVAAWVMSNIVHLHMAFDWRPVLYPLIDLMIAVVARIVWTRTGYKVAVTVTVLSLVNSLVNLAYTLVALRHGPVVPPELHHVHTLATNLIFGTKCFIVAVWGVADGFGWFDRLADYLRGDRDVVESAARSQAGEE